MKKYILLVLIIVYSNYSDLQSADISITGGLQGYLSTDFNSQSYLQYQRPNEVFNRKKGQIGLNDANFGFKISGKEYYGIISVQLGDYASAYRQNSNISLQEALAGYKLNEMLSIEAGYFLSVKGKEIFNSLEQNFSSQPWYVYYFPLNLAGINLKYQANKEFLFGFSLLNSINDSGTRTGNFGFSPSFSYKNDYMDVSFTGYYGREDFSGQELFQMYNIASAKFNITDYLLANIELSNYSVSAEQLKKAYASNMNTLTIEAAGRINKQFKVSARISFFDNQDRMLLLPQRISPDITLAFEYKPSVKSFVRLETRNITLDGIGRDNFFFHEEKPINNRTDLSIIFGFYFDRLLQEVQ